MNGTFLKIVPLPHQRIPLIDARPGTIKPKHLCFGCFKNGSFETQQMGVMQLIECFGMDLSV